MGGVQHPESGKDLLRRWLPVRIATGFAALMLAWLAIVLLGVSPRAALPMLYFMLAYAAGGLTDCLYYFFRGLDRTDLESTFTLAQRGGCSCWPSPRCGGGRTWRCSDRPCCCPPLATLVVAGIRGLAARLGMEDSAGDSGAAESAEFLQASHRLASASCSRPSISGSTSSCSSDGAEQRPLRSTTPYFDSSSPAALSRLRSSP